MKLVRTRVGHLLIWERGTTRYTVGYRVTRSVKRFYFSRHNFVVRPLALHWVAFPMTDVEKRRRGLA